MIAVVHPNWILPARGDRARSRVAIHRNLGGARKAYWPDGPVAPAVTALRLRPRHPLHLTGVHDVFHGQIVAVPTGVVTSGRRLRQPME